MLGELKVVAQQNPAWNISKVCEGVSKKHLWSEKMWTQRALTEMQDNSSVEGSVLNTDATLAFLHVVKLISSVPPTFKNSRYQD